MLTQSGLKGGDAKSLLDVGWPAFEVKFLDAVKDRAVKEHAGAKVVDFPLEMTHQASLFDAFDMAAGAENKPALKVKRLAALEEIKPRGKNVTVSSTFPAESEVSELVRPELRRARVVGNAVHALLQQLSTGR